MKYLIQTAFSKSSHLFLLLCIIVASLLFTISGQMEMFSLGIITKRGPDFFELFAPLRQGRLENVGKVSHEMVEKRWNAIDRTHSGIITQEEAEQFVQQHGKQDLVTNGMNIINRYIPIETGVGYLIALLITVAFFRAITLFSYRFSAKLLAIKVSCDLRQEYFNHIQSLPMSFYQEHNIGTLSSRVVNDAVMIADSINSLIVNYLQTPFAVVTTFCICLFISWQLSLAVFIGFPLLIIPIIYLARKIKRISKQIQKKQEAFASVLIEFLSGIQTIKIFAMEGFSRKKYQEHNEQMARLEKKSAKYDLSARPVLHTIGIFCLVTALLFGLYGLQLPLHEVLFFCGLLSTVYEPIKKFAEENGRIQRGITAAERMFEVLKLKPHIYDIDGAIDITTFTKSIEFKDVYFAYGSEWILKGLSFTIKKGESVAIVGPTGSGKSTIAQLLPRLYEVQRGQIMIDERPIQLYTQKSLRKLLASVPQKPFLFFDTVAENISIGQHYSREEIRKAAITAHADEFIQTMEYGYDTFLAEAGKTLSGGQQQRIAIARAIVKNAPILIMDEATSSLDAVSEEQIKQALKTLKGSVTQIIIAHRLSTIEYVDKIIYIEKGVKVAEGTKEELLEHCPQFKKMWSLLHATYE